MFVFEGPLLIMVVETALSTGAYIQLALKLTYVFVNGLGGRTVLFFSKEHLTKPLVQLGIKGRRETPS